MIKILLTTPDYPPKLGGLSTFTLNLEYVLKQIPEVQLEVFNWKSISDLKKKQKEIKQWDKMIHVHFMAGYFLEKKADEHINFFHGSEILFYSSSFLKRIVKKILKKKMLSYFERSSFNISISRHTQKVIETQGLKLSYERDLVFYNCIKLSKPKEIFLSDFNDDELRFVVIARDVPHKNLDGCVDFCEKLAEVSNRKIKLYITAKPRWEKSNLDIESIQNISDLERDNLLKTAHFNLLLSKDESQKGFFEGFGLTVLESGQFGTPSIVLGTGGLSESCHHKETGWVLDEINHNKVTDFWNFINKQTYEKLSKNVMSHTYSSHGLDKYMPLMKGICRK